MMWGSHGLWRSGKWEIWILWWCGSIRYIGRRGAFTSTIRRCGGGTTYVWKRWVYGVPGGGPLMGGGVATGYGCGYVGGG
jgi:hypothetical protein